MGWWGSVSRSARKLEVCGVGDGGVDGEGGDGCEGRGSGGDICMRRARRRGRGCGGWALCAGEMLACLPGGEGA